MARPIRIVIASEHSRFRDGLQKRLELESEVAVAGGACDALEAIRIVRELEADVLLIDGDVFHMSGLQEIHGSAGHVRIILLISSVDAAYAIEALQLGARGIVMKVATSELLLRSIRAVMDGRYWVNDEPVADLPDTFRELMTQTPRRAASFGLTGPELSVVAMVVSGRTNRAIAQGLSITEDAVKHHLTRIFHKLGIASRLELALFAARHQLRDRAR